MVMSELDAHHVPLGAQEPFDVQELTDFISFGFALRSRNGRERDGWVTGEEQGGESCRCCWPHCSQERSEGCCGYSSC